MPSSTASLWWMANTGPSTRTVSCGSVTTTAISMMRSVSGSRPVISRSIQIRFWSLAAAGCRSWAWRVGAKGRLSPARLHFAAHASCAQTVVSLVFSPPVLAWLALLRLWLVTRQMRHVAQHRGAVPADFAASGHLAAHQRAADYTWPRARLACWPWPSRQPPCCWAGRCWAGWTR
jgi:hypothetical protein